MRWPWSKDRDLPPPEGGGVAAPRGPAPSPMGWAFLPPVQRTLAQPIATLTAPATFPATLPAWRDPSLSGRLGHVVSDDAPAGVIDAGGLAGSPGPGVPLQRTAAGTDLTVALAPPPRPTRVQRSAVVDTDPSSDPGTVTRADGATPWTDEHTPLADSADASGAEAGHVEPSTPGPAVHELPHAPALPHATALPHAPAPHAAAGQGAVQRSVAPTTRTALTTATTAALPIAVPRVLDEPSPPLAVARSVAAPDAVTAPTISMGSGTPPVVARALEGNEPAAPTPPTTPPVSLTLAFPTIEPVIPSSAAAALADAVSTTGAGSDDAGPADSSDPGTEPSGAPAWAEAPSSPAPAAPPSDPVPTDTAPLLGGQPSSFAVQRSIDPGGPVSPTATAPTGPGTTAWSLQPAVLSAVVPTVVPAVVSVRPGARAGFGAPLHAVPATASDLPVPSVQRSPAADSPATSAPAAPPPSPTPGTDVTAQPPATPTAPTPAHDPGWAIAAPHTVGAEGHTEVDLPTAPDAGLTGHDRVDPSAEVDPSTATPLDLPLSPTPMPVVSRSATTTPIGPMVTSLSRSSALTGPGVPRQTLQVAPARTMLAPPTPPAPVQRLATAPTSVGGPTTSRVPAVAVPPRPPQPPPSSALLADPRAGGAEHGTAMPVQRSITVDDIAASLPSPGTAAPDLGADLSASLPTGVPGAPSASSPALPQGLDVVEQAVTAARPAGAPGQPGGGAEVPSGDQLEALAQRLTQPLLRRLTSQLLMDRERHGVRTDRW